MDIGSFLKSHRATRLGEQPYVSCGAQLARQVLPLALQGCAPHMGQDLGGAGLQLLPVSCLRPCGARSGPRGLQEAKPFLACLPPSRQLGQPRLACMSGLAQKRPLDTAQATLSSHLQP